MGMSSEDPDQPLDFSISSRRRNVDSAFPQPSQHQQNPQQSPSLQPSTTVINGHQSHHHHHSAAFPYAVPVHQQQADVHQSLALSSVAPPTCVAPLRLPVPEPRTGLWLQGIADAAAYAHFRRRFLSNSAATVQHAPDRDTPDRDTPTVGVPICPRTSPARTDEPDQDQEDEDDDQERSNQGVGNGNSNGNAVVIKDEAYWERRRKNNEAAKRSRDARRAKEDEIAIRAAFLEQENLKLRVEVAALKNETAKLRCMLYNS